MGVMLLLGKDGVGFYALAAGEQAKRMTKRRALRRSRAKQAHSEPKFIFSHRFSTGSPRPVDIFSTAHNEPRMAPRLQGQRLLQHEGGVRCEQNA
jgi:hypothetical protein